MTKYPFVTSTGVTGVLLPSEDIPQCYWDQFPTAFHAFTSVPERVEEEIKSLLITMPPTAGSIKPYHKIGPNYYAFIPDDRMFALQEKNEWGEVSP